MTALRKSGLAALLALGLAPVACGWMGEEPLTFLRGEQVVSRGDAIQEINLGIVTHSQSCPSLQTSAAYSMNGVVQSVFSRTHYYKNSVDFCFLILVTAPCPQSTDLNTTLAAGFYEALVRSCSPEPATM